jgi:hypothetical protein
MSHMADPYYLPSERMTMVVLLNSGADLSPHNPWPGLPKEARQPAEPSRTSGSAQRDPLLPGHWATAQAATARPMP